MTIILGKLENPLSDWISDGNVFDFSRCKHLQNQPVSSLDKVNSKLKEGLNFDGQTKCDQ